MPIMTYLLNNHIDVALIQETWLRKCDSSILKEIKEYGFNIITYRKSLSVEWGGGVAAIYRKDLKVSHIRCDNNFRTFEHVTCKVLTMEQPLLLICVYRRGYSVSNKFTVNDFISEFSTLLDDVCDSVSSILITGDFNIHVELNELHVLSDFWSSRHNDVANFLNLLDEYDLQQCVTGPTHDLGGTIDLAITSKFSPMFSDVVVGLRKEVCLSDHYHLLMKIPCKPITMSRKVTMYRRNLSNILSDSFSEQLESINLAQKVVDCGDVNEAVQNYNNLIHCVFNSVCPVNKLVVNSHQKQKWFNSELRDTKRLVRRSERKYQKSPSTANEHELENVRNLYKNSMNQRRSVYISKIFDDNEKDTSMIYRTISHYLDEDSSKTLPSGFDDLNLANMFADFFVGKVDNIRTDIDNDPSVDLSLRSAYHTTYSSNSQFSVFSPLSNQDIVKLISEMPCKLNNADPIPLSYLKSNMSLFLPSLKHIINSSLISGIFPDLLKHGNISPILKSRTLDPDSFSNYRPVTTLPFLSKLLEKAASSQIVTYLESHDLIPKYQSAYLKAHSCETALFNFTNNVQQMLSEGKIVLLVQLDFSAAFDTVDQAILLDRLQDKFGIRGTVLKWLTSYLSGRTFSVKIGYVNGRKILLLYGVPQGSVLGPLLFILYIGDLPAIASSSDVLFQSYADDSHLYAGFHPLVNFSATKEKMKACIEKFEMWMKSNYLKMNINKTEVLFIAKPQDHSLFTNLSVSIGDKCYVSSSQCNVTSLGCQISSSMSVKPTVSEIVKTCSYHLKRLSTFCYKLSEKHKLLLIKSFILNKIDYCSILLVNAPSTQIMRLQRLINKGIRFVYRLKKCDSVASCLKDSHILPVTYRVMFKSCTFVYNMLHGNCPHYMKDVILRKIPQEINLRSNRDNLLFMQTTHSTTLQYGMIKNWNCLPYRIRSAVTIETFKTQLKTYYFNIAYV